MNIGDWVQREKRGVPHLIESIVSGDVVTRCGRRLSDELTKTGGRLEVTISTLHEGGSRCQVCDRGVAIQ